MYKKYKLIKEELSLSGGANEKITNVKIMDEELKLLNVNEKENFCKKDINNYNIYIGNENFFKELEEMKKEKKQLKLKLEENKGVLWGTHTVFFNEANLLKEIESFLGTAKTKYEITEIIGDIYDLTEKKDRYRASDDFVDILSKIREMTNETPFTGIINDLSKHKDDFFDDIKNFNNFIERLKIINLDFLKFCFKKVLKRFEDVEFEALMFNLNIPPHQDINSFKESMTKINKILFIIHILEMEFNYHMMAEFGEEVSFDDIDDDQFNICYIEKDTFKWKSKKKFNKDVYFKVLFPPIRDNKTNNIAFKGFALVIKKLKKNY